MKQDIENIIKKIYRIKQRFLVRFTYYHPLRKLENRKYLTLDGIKNYDELSLKDKLSLSIEI